MLMILHVFQSYQIRLSCQLDFIGYLNVIDWGDVGMVLKFSLFYCFLSEVFLKTVDFITLENQISCFMQDIVIVS
jgi:hypothetical protein